VSVCLSHVFKNKTIVFKTEGEMCKLFFHPKKNTTKLETKFDKTKEELMKNFPYNSIGVEQLSSLANNLFHNKLRLAFDEYIFSVPNKTRRKRQSISNKSHKFFQAQNSF
jgi:hypothetical protein